MLLDKSGKVEGVVIGVGGFLGMGEHDIKVDMAKLKFVDEPVQARPRPRPPPRPVRRRRVRPRTTTTSSTPSKQWYPDHAVLSGASKDQLKSMPQFKYD